MIDGYTAYENIKDQDIIIMNVVSFIITYSIHTPIYDIRGKT